MYRLGTAIRILGGGEVAGLIHVKHVDLLGPTRCFCSGSKHFVRMKKVEDTKLNFYVGSLFQVKEHRKMYN